MSQDLPPDPHFDELLVQLSEYLHPAQTYDEATLRLTTAEVNEKLQALYPSESYGPHEVYLALKELGYVHVDPFRDMQYVWLFK